MESTLPQVATTALINVSFAWIVGVLASRFWLLKLTAAWQQSVVKRLSKAMLAGLTFCAAGIFLSLWTESAMMGDVAWLDAWSVCTQMMTSTHYGHAGVATLALLAVAMVAHWLLDRPGAGLAYIGSIATLVLLVAAARVTIGHAFEHGPFSVAVAVEWLHLLLMALWAGIVFVAGWLVLPYVLASEAAPSNERASYLASMSDWAAAALVAILATGAYNGYRVLNSPRDLVEVDYGNALLFKVALVVVAIGLGGFNKFIGLPASEISQTGLRKVTAILRLESVALVLVLIAAAVLTSSAPPGQ
jgi:putative copper resistance protein D